MINLSLCVILWLMLKNGLGILSEYTKQCLTFKPKTRESTNNIYNNNL